jgi:hypothetical protein
VYFDNLANLRKLKTILSDGRSNEEKGILINEKSNQEAGTEKRLETAVLVYYGYFKIILTSTSISLKWPLPMRFIHQNLQQVPNFPYVLQI